MRGLSTSTMPLLLLAALAGAGCGGDVQPGGTGSPTAAGPHATSTVPAPSQRLRLTFDDNGRTFRVTLRSNVTLSLPDDVRWRQPQVAGAGVAVSEELSDAPTGTRIWSLRPQATGRAVLRVAAAEGRTFAVTLDISG